MDRENTGRLHLLITLIDSDHEAGLLPMNLLGSLCGCDHTGEVSVSSAEGGEG